MTRGLRSGDESCKRGDRSCPSLFDCAAGPVRPAGRCDVWNGRADPRRQDRRRRRQCFAAVRLTLTATGAGIRYTAGRSDRRGRIRSRSHSRADRGKGSAIKTLRRARLHCLAAHICGGRRGGIPPVCIRPRQSRRSHEPVWSELCRPGGRTGGWRVGRDSGPAACWRGAPY